MGDLSPNYGTPKTVCDTEPFPPQTGDLLGAYVARLARTVVELDAERKSKSEEPSAYQRSLEARIERLENMLSETMPFDPIIELSETQPEPTAEPAATTPTATRERTHGRYGTRNLTKSKKVCATCGHGAGLHVCHKSANGIVNYWTCNAGPLGKPCLCREYKPVATEG